MTSLSPMACARSKVVRCQPTLPATVAAANDRGRQLRSECRPMGGTARQAPSRACNKACQCARPGTRSYDKHLYVQYDVITQYTSLLAAALSDISLLSTGINLIKSVRWLEQYSLGIAAESAPFRLQGFFFVAQALGSVSTSIWLL